MELRKFIVTTIRKHLNENKNLDKLVNIAKKYDYNNFLKKSDSVTDIYNILYRGMYDNELKDKSFMTDYIGHAKEYGDNIDGIVYNDGDVLYFNDNTFNDLRQYFINITKKEINDIYSDCFINDKLSDAMNDKYSNEKLIVSFVYNFIKSNVPYAKVSKSKIKNDLLVPIMLYYAKYAKNKNIISFLGNDYSNYGGTVEFVVNDVSKYKKLSDIWNSANKHNI